MNDLSRAKTSGRLEQRQTNWTLAFDSSSIAHETAIAVVLMNRCYRRGASIFVVLTALVWGLGLLETARGQFYDFTRAIPQKDSAGTPLAGANTTFADGTAFQPDGDLARSSNWAWRPFGNVAI